MRTGRPPKAPDGDKRNIVSRYFIQIAGGDSAKMKTHNIYAQLESFARSIGYQTPDGQTLNANDFRTTSIREYISRLAVPAARQAPAPMTPVFQTLDVDALLSKPLLAIRQTLIARERYLETNYLAAANAIEQYSALQQVVTDLRTELRSLSIDSEQWKQECSRLEAENRELRKAEKYLTFVIKRQVEPEQAEKYLAQTCVRRLPIQECERIAHTAVSSMIAEDQMTSQSQNNIIELDLEKLCNYSDKG